MTYQATMVMLFTLINLAKIPPYIALGQFTGPVLLTALALMPAAAIGVFLGYRLQNKIPEKLFYHLMMAALFITGLKLTWDGAAAVLRTMSTDAGICRLIGGGPYAVPSAIQCKSRRRRQENDMRLAGKIAIVTGGAQGFGEGIVRTFVREGAKVAILDLKLAEAQKLAAELGPNVALACDVASLKAVKDAVAAVIKTFGALDIVVNNAGWTYSDEPAIDTTEEEFDRVYAINVKINLQIHRRRNAASGWPQRLVHQHRLHRRPTAAPVLPGPTMS